ncbi:hemagglutinin repeat-containing protein [Pseudodesulfovibrio sp.]|uniref:hemagglutinin repeat-containing protein n=1 Tax=unclassified Pseudodesulfovibrio TaxID=2661612 RepID=UPI003B004880
MTRKISRKGMALGFRALVWLLCFQLLCPPQLVLAADPVPSGATNTTISPAGNGVPVVNIATPNSSGLSHNAYTSYDVDTHGLVLNNGDMSEAYRQSQLAGQIAGNPNLGTGNQASIILNEVTGTSRSSLEGFTEVLGGKADVIIANPNGITSSGGGFINTDRVSLVTGRPTVTDGALNYFTVSGGDILVTGTGLNASAQQMLDLVSRKVVIDGQVNAQNLNVTAGAFRWNREAGPTSIVSPDYNPTWSIDSTALGGMYAGSIKLTGDAGYGIGIGVRVKGEAAATASDFTISTGGKIEIGGKVSAKQDLSLTTSSTSTDAIAITDANLSAERNLGINAAGGGAVLTGGSLMAGGELAYNLGDLTDTASATAGITDANKRYGNTVTLTGPNPGWLDPGTWAWNIDGVYYGAGSALDMNVYSLNAAANSQATFYSGGTMSITSTHGELLFGSSALKSVGDMLVQNEYRYVRFDDGAGQGVQSTNGNITLVSTGINGYLVNKGIISADNGNVILRASDTLDNSGSIHAGGLLDARGWYAVIDASRAMTINNTGSMLAGSVAMQDINSLYVTGGGKLESTGNMDVNAYSVTIGYTDDTTSRILAATSGTGAGVFTLHNSLWNYGVLHSGHDLTVDVSNLSIKNEVTGGISAAHDMFLNAPVYVENEGAIYAGNNLSSTTDTFNNIGKYSNALGTVGAGNDITVTSGAFFFNGGHINAQHDITITAPRFTNEVHTGKRMWGPESEQEETYTGGDVYHCGTLGASTCIDTYFALTWTQEETFGGGVPGYSPRIIGGSDGTVTIKGFDTGVNLGGTISGNAVNLIGNTGATFDNSDLMVATKTFSQSKTQTLKGDDFTYSYGTITSADGPAKSAKRSYIRGKTITATGLALTNTSSTLSVASPDSLTAAGTSFAGLTLNLPGNPNGMYVTAKDPSAGYLVETNPLYADIDNFLGSDYLLQKYNFDSDEVIKRLGDAGYETFLIGQQLATKTGTTLLPSYSSEKEQMQSLMDSAAGQAKLLGLEIGTELSEHQQSLLKEDMLWMVETVVDGQTVLAPVVYLAASTKRAFASGAGASISGKNVNLAVTSLTNSGGTISGSDTLGVTATGNIVNNSGTLSGGDVALTSTGGSIVNRTTAETSGDETATSTLVGSTAGIVAKGDLQLDAAKNIANLGGDIAAGGDASLTAGKNVVLDTVENKTIAETHFHSSDTSTSSTKQIGSTLSSGGNLKVLAKKDITVAGSDVSAGGSADLNAGKNVNILAREDSAEVVSTTTNSGVGVGGGLWGKETSTTDHSQTTASGSTLSAGKDVNLSAGRTATLEGATVDAKGSVAIAAKDVNVLEARDTDSLTTHTETTSFLSVSGGEGNKKSSSSDSSAESGKVEASAEASATNDAGGIDFKTTTVTDSTDDSTTAVASRIKAGQNLTITGKKDVVLRGAEVAAGGDASLSGRNVDILAAQDTHETSSTTTTTKVGLYASTTNSVNAEATAGASANVGTGSATTSAGATAVAGAKSETSIDFVRTKTTEETSTDITNQGTTLASGGNLTINSKKNLVVQGSDLSGETGVDLTAKDMSFLAAEDSHESTSSTSRTSAGLYIDGKASAKAQAAASANAGLGVNAGGSASISGKAELSVGVQRKSSSTSDAEGSTTARVSSITSGSGSISRTAENGITDVGTAIEAGGDFTQTAKTYDSRAAANTSYKTSSSKSDVAKTGVYAKGEAGVTASAGVSAGLGLDGRPKAEAGAGVQGSASVGVGIKASYSTDSSKSASTSSQAVVSTIKTGGKIKSTTSGATTLEGTQLSGGQGVALEAASLDFKAAENTETSSSSTSNINGAVSAGVSRGTGKGFEASVSGGTSKTKTTASSSTAVAGGISSGGNISIKTKGDTRLEGTNLAATGDTGIEAGGNITLDAARDTSSSSETSYDASASLAIGDSAGGGSGKSSMDAKVAGGYSKDTASSSTAKAGSIASGGALTLTSGKTVTLEGTNMASGGDATISGADGVNFTAARSTSESSSTGVRAGVTVGTSKKSNAQGSSDSKSATVTAEVGHSKAKESIAEAGSLTSGGNLAINSGKNVTLEGTALGAANKASIDAGGEVNFKAAESTSESTAVGVALSGSASKTNKTPSTATQTPAARTGTGGTQGSDGSAQSNKDLATWQKNHGTVMDELKAKQASNAGTANQQTGTPADPAATPTVPTTETKKSAAVGIQFRTKDQTVQQAGSVSAGAGGIAIKAGGGDVNLVGTNLSTSGDASVTAKDAVNITATKNTESGFGVTIAVSADKKTEKPTAAKPAGTTGAAGTPTTPTKAASSGAASGQQAGTTAKTGTKGAATPPTKTGSSSGAASGKQAGATAKTGTASKAGTTGTTPTTTKTASTPGTKGTSAKTTGTASSPNTTSGRQAGATAKTGTPATKAKTAKTGSSSGAASGKQAGTTAKTGTAPKAGTAGTTTTTTKTASATGPKGTSAKTTGTASSPGTASGRQAGATAKTGTPATKATTAKTGSSSGAASGKQAGTTAKTGTAPKAGTTGTTTTTTKTASTTGTKGTSAKTTGTASSPNTTSGRQAGATAKTGTPATKAKTAKTGSSSGAASGKQAGTTAKTGTAPKAGTAGTTTTTTKTASATGPKGTSAKTTGTASSPGTASGRQAGATAKTGTPATKATTAKTGSSSGAASGKQAGTTAKTGTAPKAGTTGTTTPATKTASTPGTKGTSAKTTGTASSPGTASGRQAGATAKTGTPATKATTAKTGSSSGATSGQQAGTTAKTGTTGSSSGAASGQQAGTASKAGTAAQMIGSGLSIGTPGTTGTSGTTGTQPATSGEWEAEAGTSATTAKDADNTSSAFIGIGGGKSVQNQGAEISADGAVSITSGGKTTLVNTNIEAGAGESIDAAGGIERKTVKDSSLLNADTNSGAAAVNEGVSSVPVYDQSNGGAAPGMAPATGVVPPISMKNVQNGGTPPPTTP